MHILITGVNGFIGTALWNYLKGEKSSLRVFGVDIQQGNPTRNVYACDLCDPRQFRKILQRTRPKIIFHLAGGRPADENALWQVNFISTRTLLEAVAQLSGDRPRVIIPGSASEYGRVKTPQRPVTEDFPLQPLGWYGFSKYAQTSLGLMYARRGIDVRIARIFNIAGAGTPPSLAIGNFAQRIVTIERESGRPILKVGRLSGRRDFLDIEDVCSALWAIARKGKKGEVYNVCSGKTSVIRFLLRELISHAHTKISVQEERKAASTSFDIIGSNVKLQRATGWRLRVSLARSLENTLRYYRQQ